MLVMCLLAIISGSPILAPRFFRVLLDPTAGHDRISDVRETCLDDRNFTAYTEWRRLNRVLEIAEKMGNDGYILDRLRDWTRRTMRFSFTARPIADSQLSRPAP